VAFEVGGTTSPTIVNSSVARTRAYLTGAEVEGLMAAARKSSRYGHRDAIMAFELPRSVTCDGIRSSSTQGACTFDALSAERQVSIRFKVTRSRALRRLQREQPPGPHVFCSERGGPIAPKNFHTLIARLGERAGMAFPICPHLLRHACGFALANLDMTRGLSRPGSATATSNAPPDTPSCRRRGSRTSGASEANEPLTPSGYSA
jgi:integrase